jgi:hypothetical protein
MILLFIQFSLFSVTIYELFLGIQSHGVLTGTFPEHYKFVREEGLPIRFAHGQRERSQLRFVLVLVSFAGGVDGAVRGIRDDVCLGVCGGERIEEELFPGDADVVFDRTDSLGRNPGPGFDGDGSDGHSEMAATAGEVKAQIAYLGITL